MAYSKYSFSPYHSWYKTNSISLLINYLCSSAEKETSLKTNGNGADLAAFLTLLAKQVRAGLPC